jgi:hypothetical protein
MYEPNPIQRLRRHLDGAALAHADRRSAAERLADELGPELLAIVLRCLDADAPCAERRVA